MDSLEHLDVTSFVSLVANGVFGIFATYLAIALLIYELRKCHTTAIEQNIRISRLLRIFCLVAAVFALSHHFVVFTSYFVSSDSNTCRAFGILWLATYTLGLLATYIFLWTRQHTLNTSINLSELRKKVVIFLSWSALVILVLGIVMVVLAGSRLIHFSSCMANQNSEDKEQLYTIILSGILVCLTLIGQGQLLALFIFPLIHQHYRMDSTLHECRSRRTTTTPRNCSRIAIVQRCVAAAVVCVITDVAAAIATIIVQHPAAQLMYDFNLLVNVVCCVLIFPKWKQILFPCQKRATTNTVSSSADGAVQADSSNQSKV